MVTTDKQGIICDICGSISTKNFKYYSATFDMVEVDCTIKKSGPLNIDRRFLDLDVCVKCMDEIISKVKLGIEKRENKPSWSSGS